MHFVSTGQHTQMNRSSAKRSHLRVIAAALGALFVLMLTVIVSRGEALLFSFYKDQSPTLVFLHYSPYIFGRIFWHFINNSLFSPFFTFSAYYFSKCSADGRMLKFK